MKRALAIGAGAARAARFATVVPAILIAACNPADDPVDLILINGFVYTVSREWITGGTVAVEDGKIVYVGDESGIMSEAGPGTKVLDLDGKMVIPGFTDGHNHVSDHPETLFWVNTRPLLSVEEIGRALQDFRTRNPDLEQLRAIGWSETVVDETSAAAGLAPKALLDQFVSDLPVIVLSNGHHDMWVNSKALENAGIDENTPDPQGAVFERIAETPGFGEPNGILRELGAQKLIEAALPEPEFTVEQFRAGILDWQRLAAERGVTAVLVPQPRPTVNFYDALQQLDREGELSVKYDVAIWADETRGIEQIPELAAIRDKYRGELFTIDTIKMFGTGAAGLVWPQDVLNETVAELDRLGFRVFVHVIGPDSDRDAILDAFEHAIEQNGRRDLRHTITHTRTGSPEVAARFAELGVIADGHPVFPVYFDAGVPASSSSDYPVREFWPLTRVQAGVLASTDPVAGLHRYLASHTIDTAHMMFLEDRIGSIEVGKDADLVVLEQNLFAVPADQIAATKTLMTVSNGEIVFADPSLTVTER
jgi:predicted amidohydrolase YtcJ